MFAVSEELLTQVLCRLTDMLADEFCRLVSAVKTFTSAGAVTVRLQKHFIDSSFILAQVGFAEKKILYCGVRGMRWYSFAPL